MARAFSRQHPHNAAGSSRAASDEREDQRSCPAMRAEPNHGYEVARADVDVGFSWPTAVRAA